MQGAEGHEPGSYGDWLTNPGSRAAAAEQSARVHAAIERDRLEMPDVVALVRELFTERDEFMPRARLLALGPRA